MTPNKKNIKEVRSGPHKGKKMVQTNPVRIVSNGVQGDRYEIISLNQGEYEQVEIRLNKEHPWMDAKFMTADKSFQEQTLLEIYVHVRSFMDRVHELESEDEPDKLDEFVTSFELMKTFDSKWFKTILKDR